MRIGRLYIKLHVGIMLSLCSVVLLMMLITGSLIGIQEVRQSKQNESEKAISVARIVSHTPVVINGLQRHVPDGTIQSFTMQLQKDAKVRFIVVMDMHHVRMSHPNPTKIGKPFVGGDEKQAMKGKSYVSVAKGTLGTSLRAFEPIYDSSGHQIGVVCVGILMSHVAKLVSGVRHVIYTGIGIGLLIGILSALVLSRKIKRILLGLEPFEIAGLLQERNAMLESVREGILAIDKKGTIIVENTAAIRILKQAGIKGKLTGEKIDEVFPSTQFSVGLDGEKSQQDQEMTMNGLTLVMNTVPVKVNEKVVGYITTFRDRTELKRMAEELTGVKMYADSLRAKSHEFMNKLHVLLGLVHIKAYDELADYIQQLNRQYISELDQVSRLVKEPILAGFLLSKMSYAREQGVDLILSGEGGIPSNLSPDFSDDIVTILGNLIDNGIDAVQENEVRLLQVDLTCESDDLVLSVKDSGPGISSEDIDRVFEKGVSTKGEQRGFGLFLVQQCVKRLNGELEMDTDQNGTEIVVTLPLA